MKRRLFPAVAISVLLLASGCVVGRVAKPQGQEAQVIETTKSIRSAIEGTLDGPVQEGSGSIPPGTRLLSVKVQAGAKGQEIILDFSKELLSNGTGGELEDALHRILAAIGNLPEFSSTEDSTPGNFVEYTILVEGVRLEILRRN